jgi:large subunit ribosomal protein L10
MEEEKQKTEKVEEKEVKKESHTTQEIEDEKHKQEEIKKSHKRHHPVKEKAVNKLIDKMQHAKTVMVVNIKGLPSKQFQDIKKAVREQVDIQVFKKNIMQRAIEKFGKESIIPLEEKISENCAIAISDMEGYELAGILAQKKTPVAAKAGQEAPEDIEIKAGPTDLVPGPAISELGAVGLQIAVEDGKLSIKASKVIVNKGQTINAEVASVLQKLNVLPFTIGLDPVVIYDVQEEKIYSDIKIDSEEAAMNLSSAAGKALGFAQKIVYFCKETIGYLLAKANANEQALTKLKPEEEEKKEKSPAEEPKEEKAEEKKEEIQPEIKSEEEK